MLDSENIIIHESCIRLYVIVVCLGKTQRKAVRIGKKDGLCWRNHEVCCIFIMWGCRLILRYRWYFHDSVYNIVYIDTFNLICIYIYYIIHTYTCDVYYMYMNRFLHLWLYIVYNCAYPKTSDNAGVAQATQLPIRNLVARKGSAFFPPLKTE